MLVVGVGFFIACSLQAGLVRLVVGRLIGFTSQSSNLSFFAALLISAGAILFVSYYWLFWSLVVGSLLTLCFGGYSVWRLNRLLDLTRYFARVSSWFK